MDFMEASESKWKPFLGTCIVLIGAIFFPQKRSLLNWSIDTILILLLHSH
ncbi:hypothetical protein LEP1GSC115_4232 [Leptospira interrogans serovar Australis str. 200703203]|uniref:Uncharacterized protein n=1 Tax=Leptospira interrogans serovar Australis str. 200703203 TaxID=1085541 RepID=N1UHE5_LEPIR|nr:hypothetical protein LEP1GSC115_4232 [Leptospira interrogans serovar Australis str. 200703203]